MDDAAIAKHFANLRELISSGFGEVNTHLTTLNGSVAELVLFRTKQELLNQQLTGCVHNLDVDVAVLQAITEQRAERASEVRADQKKETWWTRDRLWQIALGGALLGTIAVELITLLKGG